MAGIAALIILLLCMGSMPRTLQAQTAPDWTEAAPLGADDRRNPYELDTDTWRREITAGQLHSFNYPVAVSALQLPLELLQKVFKPSPFGRFDPVKNLQALIGLETFDDFEALAGLVPIARSGANRYGLPTPETRSIARRYGTSFIDGPHGSGVSFSCAACHVSELFGVPIFGLQNRFPRGNEFFVLGKRVMDIVDPHIAGALLGLSPGGKSLLLQDKRALASIESQTPLKDGLDTSLSHVALSLSHREKDAWASLSPELAKTPRSETLRSFSADSKPGNWWVLKYKNRWLLDGSVVSGNPIFTNILWNEIGRGTDLRELEAWLDANSRTIRELATAVFASEAPPYTDFFPASSIDLEAAKRGAQRFEENCSRCHGHYEKNWDRPEAAELSTLDLLKTHRVRYFADTPVLSVGTDQQRSQGMRSLEQLNDLTLSQKNGIVIKAQSGYVPPPLVGIWARWPYFHNNSAPSLCAVLTAGPARPKRYAAGEAIDPKRDFDAECNGYPSWELAPSSWKRNPRRVFDTTLPGLGNGGHDQGILIKAGRELLSPRDKRDLIQFLKTL